MFRFILYLFPAFVNCILGGIFFFSADSFSRLGASGFLIGCTTASWSLLYSLISLFLGKFVNEQNCKRLIMAGAAILFLASIGFFLCAGFYLQFLWIGLSGIGAAIYCTPFQLYMKILEPNKDSCIVRPTALYTMSWSFGMAAGPFLFGFLGHYAFLVNAGMAMMMFLGIHIVSLLPRSSAPASTSSEEVDYTKYPNLVMAGWIVGGVGSLAVFIIRCMEPHRAHILNFSSSDAAFILALLSLVQGVTALCLIASRTWMFKPVSAILIGLCGAAGLLLFGFGTTPGIFYLASAVYGVYSAFIYFCFVFYSLARPDSVKYIAVNETLVGLVGVLGPVIGGLMAGKDRTDLPFLAGAGLVLGAGLLHLRWILVKKTEKSEKK